MPASPSPLPRSSRVRNAAVVVALVAVGLAARGRDAQGTQPPAAPPAAPTATAAPDSAVQDSTKADSTAVADTLMDLSLVMAAEAAAAAATTAPVAVAPSAWPVDPTTGQTLINGRPVVGRVFIMRKTDGTVKYPNVADVVAHEALAPLPPVVGSSYQQAPITNQRRMRGIMIQSTLWDMDRKRSATRQRYYPASTPANQLGQ